MKQLTTILFLAIVFCSGLRSQTAARLFATMPEIEMPLLDAIARNELLDGFSTDSGTLNILEDTCRLTALTDNYLQLTVPGGTTELIVLPMPNESHVVCLIQTVCAPVCDSRIGFFTTTWKRLDADLFFVPTLREKNLSGSIDFVSYRFRPADATLIQHCTTMSATADATAQQSDSLIFKWKAGRFE
jgi:hypothetical protein